MSWFHPASDGEEEEEKEGMELAKGWRCPFCDTVNGLQQLNCHLCLQGKPGEKVDHIAEQERKVPKSGVIKRSFTEKLKSLFAREPLEWVCPNCTLLNDGRSGKCSVCGFWREDAVVRVRAEPRGSGRGLQGNRNWSIPNLLTSLVSWRPEEKGRERGEGKRRIATDDGEEGEGPVWQCVECTVDNPASVDQCGVCMTKRQGVADFVLGDDSFEELHINGESVNKRRKLEDSPDLPEANSPSSFLSGDSGMSSMPSARTSPGAGLADSTEAQEQPVSNGRSYPTGHRRHHSNGRPPAPSPSVLDAPPDQPSMVAPCESETWRCSVCGAYSLLSLPKCFVCGIGANPTAARKPSWRSRLFGSRKSSRGQISTPSSGAHVVSHMTNHTPSSAPPSPPPPPHLDPLPEVKETSRAAAEGSQEEATEEPPVEKPVLRERVWSRQSSGHRSSGPQALLETPGRTNRTTLISEERQLAELEASGAFNRIQMFCRKSREPFTDPDFPPAEVSLYENPRKPVSHWKVSQWLRPRDIVDSFSAPRTQWAVFRNPRPEDIAQGVLGNCWVLSALTVIAERPDLIQEIVLTKKYCPTEGAYQVRLCKNGQWETVVVDDCLPCYSSRELVFSKAYRKQLWVPLIEKALAKLYGSYEALNSGRVLSGLSILTGLPCEKIYLRKQASGDEDMDFDLLWAQLLSFREQGFPMGASCGGHNIVEDDYFSVGLEPSHAYSVLNVRQFHDYYGNHRLIRLRNPWGKYSWKGAWSDRDKRWTPELREELQAMGSEEGIFWMDIDDFFRYFCEVDVCKYRPNWYSARMDGDLPPYAPNQQRLLAFEVTTTTEVDISAYQPSLRDSSTRSLVDMAVLVMRYPQTSDSPGTMAESIPLPVTCAIASGSHIQSIVTCNGFLDPGKYVILPLAFSHYHQPLTKDHGSGGEGGSQGRDEGSAIPYVVALFSARNVTFNPVLTRPGFTTESLFILAQNNGTCSQPFPKMYLYEVYLKHSCRVLVAVNGDPHYHFTVTCNGVESANVLTTRGGLYTTDCVPPMHRQVVFVLTQVEASQPYSVLMRIEFNRSEVNPLGGWGAHHHPELHPGITELHSPRLIS